MPPAQAGIEERLLAHWRPRHDEGSLVFPPLIIAYFSPGAIGGNAVLMSSLSTVEVALASGKIVTWTWEKSPDEMRTLCCGLGMAGIVLSVTFQCIPLQR